MRRGFRVRTLGALMLAAALALPAIAIPSAQADPTIHTADQPLADPAQEARARALMREIRCVVCQSQSIDESDADIAANFRNIVREQIAAGRSDQEILDYLTARYGDFVLFDPPFRATTLILWVGPFALLALGLVVAMAILRRQRNAKTAAGGLAPPDLSERERRRLQELLTEPDSGAGKSA